ncbi:hypothetical protein KYB31_15575 [Clostridium felsineum]|uniref:hypothetical protein n=1 Tax=Clostridium felsineum TaxID=36839 RepID=UPI00214DB324|nr:hypothetical protein [Clostridium felsineum]MCR3760397.1 hypothetical protein [Clostridium felsineum]
MSNYTEKEALEYLVNLGETKVLKIDGQQFTTKQVYAVREPIPASIQVTTLTALVDYIKSNFDTKASEKLLIHVKSPVEVSLCSELRSDAEREEYIKCRALLPDNICFDRFMDTESFNIMLQSSFDSKTILQEDKEVDFKELLLKVTGCIKDNVVKQIGDDGVSQAATIKTGVASVADVKVPNPVILAPFRTFPEVKQPASKFIFRMQSGPRAALFEADGGTWRNIAMISIKKLLQEQLKEFENVEIIA